MYSNEGNRYRQFRDCMYGDGDFGAPSLRVGEESEESEMELQARWFGGEFGRRFTGFDSEKIEVVQFGHWNHAAGPDFTEAAVRINGVLKRGAIEIDFDARDWEAHRHSTNPDYEEVVLHVFKDVPASSRFFTRTKCHRRVSQLLLPQYAWSEGPPDFLPEAIAGRCIAPLSRMSDKEVSSLLVSAAKYRLERKTARLGIMSGVISREQALFQGIAEALGYHQNASAMAILSQRCPVRKLTSMDPMDREAMLFGVAGFLDHRRLQGMPLSDSRDYFRRLWERWWKLRSEEECTIERAIPWRFSGSRPGNHPERRVGAMAVLVSHWHEVLGIVNNLLAMGENSVEKTVNNLFRKIGHPFWERHFTMQSGTTPVRLRLVGPERCRDLLGNVVFPLMSGTSEDPLQEYFAMRGGGSNRELRRAGLRLFGDNEARRKLFTSYYYQQQALLQIYRDFCLEDASECANCPFPEQLSQWENPQIEASLKVKELVASESVC